MSETTSPTPPSPPADPTGVAPPPTSDSPPTTAGVPPQYEFNDEQNEVINHLALAIVWVRIPLLVAGIFQAMIATGLAFRLGRDGAHIIGVLGSVLSAVVCLMLANWLLRAASAFAQITTTKGRDISHLMTALRSLGSWFDLLAFFVKLYLFLLGLVMLLLFVGSLAGAFKGPE